LLHLNGKDLRNEPLDSRRAKLKELVRAKLESRLQFSEEFTEGGAALFRACVEHGLEGIVSKLASSKYRSGRSKTWLKTKCFTKSAFLIIGTARDRKTGAALLARAEPEGLSYVGSAFIALAGKERDELQGHLVNKVERCPLSGFRFPDAQG
jgi:bifunctional non-homologous end joining protein LigD